MAEEYATVNGNRIVSGSITLPYYGIGAVDAVMAGDDEVSDPCVVTVGNLVWTGSIFRSHAFAGSRSLRMVGGGGGWRKLVDSQAYSNPAGVRLSTVMNDVSSAVGEEVNLADDMTIGTFFVRENAQAQRVLRQLAGDIWWMDLEGVTQVGPRSGSTVSSDFLIQSFNPSTGKFVISTEDLASWTPGNTFSNELVKDVQTISSVRHVVSEDGKSRVEVMVTP